MRAAIFDLDDTLYPWQRYAQSADAAVASYAAASFGLAAQDVFALLCRARRKRPGRELQALCARYRLPESVIPDLVAVSRRHRPTLWLAYDAERTLRRLRADGWKLAVLTNGLPSVQARKVEALGLAALVDHIVYAEDHAPGGKPHPAPFAETLRRLDVAPAQCVCVGDDAARDVAGARRAGIWSMRVARAGEPPAAGAPDAHAVVASLDQVPALAASMLQAEACHAA